MEFACRELSGRRELGWRPTLTLDEAVRRTVTWERAHPPDPIPAGLLHYDAEDQVLAAL